MGKKLSQLGLPGKGRWVGWVMKKWGHEHTNKKNHNKPKKKTDEK